MNSFSRSGYLIAAAALFISAPYPALASTDELTTAQSFQQLDHISVEVVGTDGPAVILIPGLSTPREVWRGVVPALARTHQVYLVQVNGFGGDDPRENLRPGILPGIMEDLVQLIQAQNLGKPIIVGHSMGGLAGLMLAARHPDHVGRLMVVDALPYFGVLAAPPGTDVTVEMIEPQAAQMRDAVAGSYGQAPTAAAIDANVRGMSLRTENLPMLRAWAVASDPRVAAQAMYENLTTDMRPEVSQIRAPVKVIYAWNQTYPRKEPATAFFIREYALLPDVEITEVGESAHFVMLDQPAAFQAELIKFLQ